MLISVNKIGLTADNFSKNSSNFFRFLNSDFGLGFLSTETNNTSKILSQLINKSC